MKLKTICNIALFVLCVSGIVINYFFEQYKTNEKLDEYRLYFKIGAWTK